MKGFLDYIPGDSLLHKLNPLTKLLLSLCICICCFVADNHFVLLGMIAVSLLLGAVGEILPTALRMLKGLVKISIFLFILQIFFVRNGNILLQLPLNLYITDEGISFALRVVLRLMGATMPLALMLSITPMNDLSNVMVVKLHIPFKYAFTFTTAVRFIPILAQEMAGIMEAQTARGVEFDTKNPFKKLSLILPLCVPLLLSCVKKTDASAISAELRGFNLRTRSSCYKEYPFYLKDFAMMAVSILCVAGVSFIA